jgi:hypothetical protein
MYVHLFFQLNPSCQMCANNDIDGIEMSRFCFFTANVKDAYSEIMLITRQWKGNIRISNILIYKYLSESAVGKSEDKDVHMSVLNILPDLIRESVDAEQHPDYIKGEDGVRNQKMVQTRG